MKTKKLWWGVSAGLMAVVVAAVAVMGVLTQREYGDLERPPAFAVERPEPYLAPALAEQGVDNTALGQRLTELAGAPALGTFHGRVTDTVTGQVVWEESAGQALRPASATKVLTAAAAILELDPTDRLSTQILRDPASETYVIRASGDVWLTGEQLDEIAEDLAPADVVLIDTSAWQGPTLLPGWGENNVGEGYIAPLEPAMLHGGRLGGTTGDLPRSDTPALDVARALAERVGADSAAEGSVPRDATVVATLTSPTLMERLGDMVSDSDNVMAEAIGREVAIHRGLRPTAVNAIRATLDVLTEHGFDVTGTELADNSGLSRRNLISPALLDDILHTAATGDGSGLRPLLATLPVAGGTGTLTDRYSDLSGRGWVRAKTGTLTGTSALAGVVTAESGRIYSFALLSNDAEITASRRALDTFASTIRES